MMNLGDWFLNYVLNYIKKKEKEINDYVYYFIKTNYTKIDIINAFKSYESFENFMNEVEYKLSQDEVFKKIL